MTPSYPSRRSTRLQGYDYSRAGAYFVTLCVEARLPLLGAVEDDILKLSPAGEMVAEVWGNLETFYSGVSADAFVVMPNHVHGILVLGGVLTSDCSAQEVARGTPLSLPYVMARFKSFTSHRYGKGVESDGWTRYPGRLWQHRYYDRVIRNERELNAIREYIRLNPERWLLDHENPEVFPVMQDQRRSNGRSTRIHGSPLLHNRNRRDS